MRLLLTLAAVAPLLTPPPAHPTEARCASAPLVAATVDDVVSALDAGTPEALGRLVAARWDTTRLGARRGALLTALHAWRWRSPSLRAVEVCPVTATTGYALLRSAGREIDSLWVDVDSATGLLRGLRIPQRGRLVIDAADTASDAARAAALRRLVDDLAAAGVFSGEVLLARDGRVLLHTAAGLADREARRPARLGEQYNIASVGKMFTATAVMQLAEQRKLSTDDTLGAFLRAGERPAGAGGVALKFLLTHTAGVARGRDSLAFAPGTRFEYSNYGYHLLAGVITAVTGLPFDEHFRRALFEPLGMRRTARLVRAAPDPSLAPAYDVRIDSAGVRLVRNPEAQTTPATGAGGMFSTAEDLFRFAEGLRRGRVLAPATVADMRRPRPEWGAVDYGFGIDLQRGDGIWGANGYIPGANADVEIYGDSGWVLVVLANLPANEPVRRFAAGLLGYS
jgi:CubicO group peptidase (beta-lactamase class C family)